MDILITLIGAGALGKALSYSLTQVTGYDVRLHARSGFIQEPFDVLDHGVSKTVQVKGDASGDSPIYIFTTKAYDLSSALEEWLPRIPTTARIVLLSNGYIEPLLFPLRKKFPNHRLTKGVVTRGARFLPTGQLQLSDQGHISWGDEQGARDFETQIFAQRAELKWDAGSCEARKDKWYCNTVLNTLCGAYRLVKNGLALEHPEFEALSKEVFALSGELWPERSTSFTRERLHTLAKNLINATSGNENSMAVDVRLGRRTEIDVLSGVAKTCANYELKFPLLMKMHKQIESSKI
ncbi:MAG: hypothetical protein EOP10_13405 [Proteobacteria bacterium]|nr:MAG: hypothetical protein EOP10_13405 [Pseudomonadota bacterium]